MFRDAPFFSTALSSQEQDEARRKAEEERRLREEEARRLERQARSADKEICTQLSQLGLGTYNYEP